MIFLQLNRGGTIAFDLPQRPDANTYVTTIYNPAGGIVAATASVVLVDVNTGITTAVGRGSSSLSVDSATSMSVGARLLLDGSEDNGGERVTVKSVSGSTVALLRPLLFVHPSGSQLQSTRLTVTLSGSQCTAVGRSYRGETVYQVNGQDQPPHVFSFDVTRYNPMSSIDVESMRDLDPNLTNKLPIGFSWKALRDKTWNMVLTRVGASLDPGAIVGTLDLTVPHQFAIRMTLFEDAGSEFREQRDLMAQRFGEELEACLATQTVDTNQDGVIASNEAWRRTIKLVRA